jgi:hypothetical protein
MMRSLLALLFAASICTAQSENNRLTDAERKAGWRLLFDGTTFNGWIDPASKTPPGDAWAIEAGCIRTRPRPRFIEDLVSKDTYRDFELMFDWRIAPGANSGVKYRIQDFIFIRASKTKGRRFEDAALEEMRTRPKRAELDAAERAQDYVIGFEYQLIDNTKHADAMRGAKYQSGALYDMAGASSAAARAPGEWNQARILLRGNHAEHWVNGAKVVGTMLDAPEVLENVARRWGKESEVYRLLATQPRRDCPVSLQNHNDEAWFRNIKIRRLK